MKLGKVIAAGFVVTVFKAIVGMVTCGGIFNWVYKLEPVSVWKSMTAPPGVAFYLVTFLLCVIMAAVYAILRKGIPGKNKFIKGLVFGLSIWAVGCLPGMLATYFFMNVATTVIVYWTIMGLVQTPIEGLIIAAMYEKK